MLATKARVCLRNAAARLVFPANHFTDGLADFRDARQFLDSADRAGIQPDTSTYARLIQSCCRSRDLAQSRNVHAHLVRSGLKRTVFLEDQIVEMYIKCGSFEDARCVFQQMVSECDLVSWTRMISSCAKLGEPEEALQLFRRMQLQGFFPDKVALIAALSACDSSCWLAAGVEIHSRILQAGLQNDVVVSNALVNMYGKCGDVPNACGIFEAVPRQDAISWNGMITVYAQQGLSREALELFNRMHSEGILPNRVTFLTILGTISGGEALAEGKRIHEQVVESGYGGEFSVGNSLVDMYRKCRSLQDARTVFETIVEKNVVSWTSLIAAFAECGSCKEALVTSKKMLQDGTIPNRITFLAMLDACGTVNAFCMSSPAAVLVDLTEAKLIHSIIVESGLELEFSVASALVYIYGKCGCLEVSREIFSRIRRPDLVLRTAMIAAYAQFGDYSQAFELYQEMQDDGLTPDKVLFLSLLNGCGTPEALIYGKLTHAQAAKLGFEAEVPVGNAVIHMYGKCGNVGDARKMFDKMVERDIVSWTTMIAVYAEHGCDIEALQIFKQMQVESVNPDKVTIINILDACSNVSGLAQGRLIHKEISESGYLELDLILGNAIARMYGNCGSLGDARRVFDSVLLKDVVSWNCLITSYAQHGFYEEGLLLFKKMQGDCVKPDEVTFVGVLSACSHGGLVNDGCRFFVSMIQDYEIAAGEIHYGCMVDLLGRAGRLGEAEELIQRLHYAANEIMWTSLLGACKVHRDLERGKRAARKLLGLVPGDSTPLVALASIYAASGEAEEAEKMREQARVMKLLVAGKSCIEVDNQVHEFAMGDRSHPQAEAVYAEVERLERLMKDDDGELEVDEGGDEEEKKYHCEKLAVGFGLISTPAGTALRVKTSDRICNQCHAACKFISKIAGRAIMVKDSRGFHHFKDGTCSCKEFW